MLHEKITEDIIGAAIAVLNELKPGLDEKLYENALVIELQARGRSVEQQREYPAYYRSHFIGKLIPDLIVDGKVIVDPKVVTEFNDTHIAQMPGYLNITGLEVALLLNFKNTKLDWKRIVREKGRKNTGDGIWIKQYPRYPRNPRSNNTFLLPSSAVFFPVLLNSFSNSQV